MDKGIVIAFGRFNPPTTGHKELLSYLSQVARARKADLVVFPSVSQDSKRNPLPFDEKVWFLKKMFGQYNFSHDPRIKTPIDALMLCSSLGYDKVWVVVGSDRVEDFMRLSKYVKQSGIRGQDIVLKEYGVLVVPAQRDLDAEGTAGMSASKMRAAAAANDYEKFISGVPHLMYARQLFDSVRKHMNIKESKEMQRAFLLYDTADNRLAKAVQEHTHMRVLTPRDIMFNTADYKQVLSSKLPFSVDVRAESYVSIRHIYGRLESASTVPTVYIPQQKSKVLGEQSIGRITTNGLLKRASLNVVEVATPGMMLTHMTDSIKEEYGRHQCKPCGHVWWGADLKKCPKCGRPQPVEVAEAEGAPKLKTPTEVDRLKANQKQQELMLKQRQAQELLQAKQRELSRKTRDDMNRIKTGNKPEGAK